MGAYIDVFNHIHLTPAEGLIPITLPEHAQSWPKIKLESYCYIPSEIGFAFYQWRSDEEINNLETQDQINQLTVDVLEMEYQLTTGEVL